MYHSCPHSVFMCFVWIWEQPAIISLYSINWLVFITETECVLRGTFYTHIVFRCFDWISERTAIIPLYKIYWLFLGAFAKLRKATISFVMSVYPSAWNNSAPTELISIKHDIWAFFPKICLEN
jgi:hypothetical protein